MVIAENPYGMLKGRWQIILKKCEARMYNMKYIVSAAVVLHTMYLFQWPVWTKIVINGRGIRFDSKQWHSKTGKFIKWVVDIMYKYFLAGVVFSFILILACKKMWTYRSL